MIGCINIQIRKRQNYFIHRHDHLCRNNIPNLIAFPYASNEQSENQIIKTPFPSIKNIKFLRINLIKKKCKIYTLKTKKHCQEKLKI